MSLGRILVSLLVASTVAAALHAYVWARLVRDAAVPPPWSRVATVALAALAVLLVASFPLMRVLPRSSMTVVAWVAFGWLGLLFLLVSALALSDVVRLGASLWDRVREGPPDPSRRVLIGRALAAASGIAAATAAGFGVRTALAEVTVRKHRVPLRRLPDAFAGLRIAHITDLHVGPTIGKDYVERIVAQTNALDPDVIVITGDLVDGRVEDLREHVAPLARLRAPLGVYFVTGNHEYYSGVDAWLAELARLGVRTLRNERVELRRGDQAIDLAGVDDWSSRSFGRGHGHDLARAVAGRDPTRELILLAHQPKAIADAARHGVGLQLSGHTHGGQIFPFNFLVKLQQPYVAGLHRHDDTFIYVSRGTGYWGPPMRVGIRAEIALLELARA